jgi:uncharacterized protein (DUF2252 family)
VNVATATANAGPVTHPSRAERIAAGKAARTKVPLDSHGDFTTDPERDPIGLLLGQAESRVPELVPIRHGRMLVSPFAFFRGAALPMAADLGLLPSSGLRVQLCGDAHLANFGAFASPERRLVFDVNDFDETLPGPFEWDVKRLAASLVVAAQDNSYTRKEQRRIALASAASYRQTMLDFANRSIMDVWYTHLNIEDAVKAIRDKIEKQRYRKAEKMLAKARTRDSMQALSKLTTQTDEGRRFLNTPPLLVPVEDVLNTLDRNAIYDELHSVLRGYRRTLQSDRRHLLEQFRLVQVARKVVGVGSVGTRAWVLLLEAGDGIEPLFLQAKEAQRSVLAEFAGESKYRNQGQRVVAGQHLMQATSDIFLGWQRVKGPDGVERDFYLRQLRDWKFSVPIELMVPTGMEEYAKLCGWTLARAHARSGDRLALAAYLGKSDKFEQAVVRFAQAYAEQNERDYNTLKEAVDAGRVSAQTGL